MKSKWVSFYSGIAASSVMTGTLIAANHMAKKYGQKPKEEKMFKLNTINIIDYGVKKFLEADDEQIQKILGFINKDKHNIKTE